MAKERRPKLYRFSFLYWHNEDPDSIQPAMDKITRRLEDDGRVESWAEFTRDNKDGRARCMLKFSPDDVDDWREAWEVARYALETTYHSNLDIPQKGQKSKPVKPPEEPPPF